VKIKVGLVQISPNYDDNRFYMPYSIGILQAYAKKHLSNYDDFEFLDIIYKRENVEKLTEKLIEAEIVFFSTYVWNFIISSIVAKNLKKLNKEVVIVFGGPQVDTDNIEEFLKENNFIDLACFGEGETIFKSILENFETRDFSKVLGISYLDENKKLIKTNPAPIIENVDTIPSLFLSGVFDSTFKKEEKWIAINETNRGCPYNCTYCNWGGTVGEKVRFFSIERIKQEIKWFSDNKIDLLFICDANFGLYERDLEIVKFLAKCKAETGFPEKIFVSSSKKFNDCVYEIFKIFAESNFGINASLALQSTNKETLKAIKRYNFSLEEFREAKNRLTKNKILSITDLIIGLPNETYESFKEGVSEIISHGQHDRIIFSNLFILPNTEMNKREYQEKYGFKTKKLNLVYRHGELQDLKSEIHEIQETVISTNTLNKEDWIKCNIFGNMTSLIYHNKLLQIPMLVINSLKGTSFSSMIELLLDSTESRIFNELKNLFKIDILQMIEEDFSYNELCSKWFNIYWRPEELAFIKVVIEYGLDNFYKDAKNILFKDLTEEEKDIVNDAMELNKKLIIIPFIEKDFTYKTNYNIVEFYNSILNGNKIDIIKKENLIKIKSSKKYFDSVKKWSKELVWWQFRLGAYLYEYEEIV